MRKLLTGSYAALLVLLVAAPAVASQPAPPQYQSSEPSEGAKVHEPPARVEVTFDQPLDGASSLTVTDECDRRIDDGATEVSGATMSVALEEGPSGTYRVEYLARGLGGVTGQKEGQFTFLSHSGTSCGKTTGGGPAHHGNGGDNQSDGQGGNHGGQKAGSHSGTTDHGSTGDSSTHDTNSHTGASGGPSHTGASGGPSHGASTHPSGAGSSQAGGGSHATGATGSHTGGNNGGTAAGGFDGITSSDTGSERLPRATSTMLLIALSLCAALGIVGGAVLRATRAR